MNDQFRAVDFDFSKSALLATFAKMRFSNCVRVHLMVCHKVSENIPHNINTLNAMRDSRRVTNILFLCKLHIWKARSIVQSPA